MPDDIKAAIISLLQRVESEKTLRVIYSFIERAVEIEEKP